MLYAQSLCRYLPSISHTWHFCLLEKCNRKGRVDGQADKRSYQVFFYLLRICFYLMMIYNSLKKKFLKKKEFALLCGWYFPKLPQWHRGVMTSAYQEIMSFFCWMGTNKNQFCGCSSYVFISFHSGRCQKILWKNVFQRSVWLCKEGRMKWEAFRGNKKSTSCYSPASSSIVYRKTDVQHNLNS